MSDMQQLPLEVRLVPAQRFDNFLVGRNAAGVQALSQAQPGDPPFLLWGPSGSGKSHVLSAMQSVWEERGLRVARFGAFDRAPWDTAMDASLLLLDQAEQWTPEQQQAAFARLVQATDRGALWVAASRLPPIDLPLREDVRTRLAWGQVLPWLPLADEELPLALQQASLERGLHLSDEVVEYLLRRQRRDLKSLVHELDRLDRFALSHQRAVTIPLVRQWLHHRQEP